MKYLSVLVLIIGTLLAGCGGSGLVVDPLAHNGTMGNDAVVPFKIPFEVITDRGFSEHEQRLVITSNDAWEKLWSDIHAPGAVPQIDFNTSTVIAVFMGAIADGRYHIEVKEVLERNAAVTVVVEQSQAGDRCGVFQMPTSPLQIVKVAKITKPIIFTTQHVVHNCE
jgi:hypothetical protein